MPRQWSHEPAVLLTSQLYQQVLDRLPDPQGKGLRIAQLEQGSHSVKDLVKALGTSNEYRDRFVSGYYERKDWHSIVTFMYQKFLARLPENETVIKSHSKTIVSHSWETLARGIIDSNEYAQRFNTDIVPGHALVADQAGAVNTYAFCVADAQQNFLDRTATGHSWEEAQAKLQKQFPGTQVLPGNCSLYHHQ